MTRKKQVIEVYDNLYCKLYLDAMSEKDELYSLLQELTCGKAEPISIIKTACCEMYLGRNKEFDINLQNKDRTDFIYWQYYLDIEPTNSEQEEYIKEIAALILKLKKININAVPSCDFEEEIHCLMQAE